MVNAVALKSDKYRVLLVGDSHTEGVGLDYDNTFANHIASLHPEIDILNAGVVSYSPKIIFSESKLFTGKGRT